MPSASWSPRNASVTARWLLNEGIEYAKGRIVFDRPIGQNQGVQFPLARAYAELEADRWLEQ